MARLELAIPKALDFKSRMYTVPSHTHYVTICVFIPHIFPEFILHYRAPVSTLKKLGRAGGNQTLVDRLKADYSIIELQPHCITLF